MPKPVIDEGSEESETSIETQEADEVSENEVSEKEETSEGDSTETVEQTPPQEEWLIPGRFKKGEETKLAQSYQSLESEFSRRGNELHRLKSQPITPVVDRKTANEQWAAEVAKDPEAAVRNLVRSETAEAKTEVQKVKFETEYNRLKANKEFVELEPVMTEIAQNSGDFINDSNRYNPQLLHYLYYMAKGVKADEKARQAESTGKLKGEKSALKKTKAQVEGSSGSKGHSKRKFEDLSLEEMRKDLQKGRLLD